MADSVMQILIEAVDNASKVVSGIAKNMEAMGKTVTNVGKAMTVGITAPVAAGLGFAANEAIQFESAMADVNKVLSDPPPQFEQSLLEMTRDIPIAATGLAEIAASGAQLGVAGSDIEQFTEIVAQMSTAFDMSADQAGESVAKMMTVLSLRNMDEVRQVGDLFNHLSDNSGAAASALVDVATRIGGNAKNFGLANEEIAALSAAFVEMAPSPEIAATAINSMLPILQSATRQAPKFQEALQEIGLTAEGMEKAIAKDGIGAIQDFIGALSDLDQGARAGVLKDLFGSGADANLIATLASDTSILADNLATVADSGVVAGSMLREFQARSETTANQMQLFRNNLTEAAITIGAHVLPAINGILDAIRPMIEAFADFAEQHPGIVRVGVAIAATAAAIGPLLIGIGALISAVGTISSAWAGFTALFAAGGALAGAVPVLVAVKTAMLGLAAAAAKLATFAGALAAIPALIFKIGAAASGVNIKFSEMPGIIGGALQTSASRVQEVGPAITGAISALVNIARLKFLELKNAVVSVAGTILSAITTPIQTGAQMVISAVSSIVSAVTSGMAQFVAAITSGASQAVSAIVSMGAGMISAVTGLAGQFMAAGANLISSLIQGIMSKLGEAKAAIGNVARTLRGALPFSPAKWGPLSDLDKSGPALIRTVTDGMSTAPVRGAMGEAMGSALAPSIPSSGGGGGNNITVNYSPTINGASDPQAVQQTLSLHVEELRAMLEQLQHQDRRLSYG